MKQGYLSAARNEELKRELVKSLSRKMILNDKRNKIAKLVLFLSLPLLVCSLQLQ
jgi:hypothetical protein